MQKPPTQPCVGGDIDGFWAVCTAAGCVLTPTWSGPSHVFLSALALFLFQATLEVLGAALGTVQGAELGT